MPTSSQFDPVLSQHAIERCVASATFSPNLPEKTFSRLLETVTSNLAPQGFVAQKTAGFSFEFSAGGQVKPIDPFAAPRSFVSASQGAVLTFSPDGLVWTSTSYVRWQPFIGAFERYVVPIMHSVLETVSVNAARLEYWDRFFWSGSWDDFAIGQLLRADSDLFAAANLRRPKEWHSHVGWFAKEGEFRRLTNVNIDVQEAAIGPTVSPLPSVGIYSSLTDQANVPGYGSTKQDDLQEGFVVGRLEDQHLALKQILGHIITDGMSNRIGLFPRKSSNASR